MLLRKKLVHSRSQFSPVIPEFSRVEKEGPEGKVFSFAPTDFEAIAATNGTIGLWDLRTMLAAGISPKPIHTSSSQRLSLEEQAIAFENQLDTVLSSVEPSTEPSVKPSVEPSEE